MKVKISKELIDNIIIDFMLLQVFIMRFLGLDKYFNWAIIALIIVKFFLDKEKKLKQSQAKLILILMLIYVFFFLSSYMGHYTSFSLLRKNLFALSYVFLYYLYITFLCKKNWTFVRNKMINLFWVFNLYFVINIFVLIIQIKTPGVMAGYSTKVNPLKLDLISGLFGYSGTHQLCIYSCFIILYNLCYFRYYAKKYKKLLAFYTAFLFVFSCVVSMFNDNKMFYLLIVVFLGLYYLVEFWDARSVNSQYVSLFKIVVIIIILVALGVILYNTNSSIKHMFDSNIGDMMFKLRRTLDNKNIFIAGSAERIYMLIYAFTKFDAVFFGYGLASYTFYDAEALGFKHFGQADLGTMLCLGGLWFTILCVAFYLYCWNSICDLSSNQFIVKLYNMGICLLIGVYTVSFKNISIAILLLFLYIAIGLSNREKKQCKNKEEIGENA